MHYLKMAKEGKQIPAGIHTKIYGKLRISSIFRSWGNPYFHSYGWETFLWDGDKIIEEFGAISDAENVVDLHCRIYEEKMKEVTK